MKVRVINKTVLIALLVMIPVLSMLSCSPKTILSDDESDGDKYDITISSNSELLYSYKKNSVALTAEEYPSPLKKELDGLRYVLKPYLSAGNELFIGNYDKEYIENYFLNPDTSNLAMPATDWERVVRLLLVFDDENCQYVKTNITDYTIDDKIERKYALAGLMNLLALRYPLSLDADNEELQKSIVITDLETIEEKHKLLIRKAYCLGFTDFSVDETRLFRPDAFLNRGEAISMFYRIFTNLGLPSANPDDSMVINDTVNTTKDTSSSDQTQEVYSVEDIISEYYYYKNSLLKSKKTADITKLEMLYRAEKILDIDNRSQFSRNTLDINTWIFILSEVFELENEQVKACIPNNKYNILTYDVAAISIFEFPNLTGEEKPGDVDEKELIAAREAIPQFDTAEDISRFARMFSSGILEGIHKIPGFTPKRPVNNAEALLIIMRIVKGL